MKRRDLVEHLKMNGCVKEREGGRHTVFRNLVHDIAASIPRHREINTFTARAICKDLRVPVPLFK